MEPTSQAVVPKRGPSSPKIIVDSNLTIQNSSAIRPTPVKAGKTITHLDNSKQLQVSHGSLSIYRAGDMRLFLASLGTKIPHILSGTDMNHAGSQSDQQNKNFKGRRPK